ncbi:MAG TPA: signal recognition particle-docking protein FtsY [Firmicutes bacterium]|nr:signal recognition particle-docking protein FtsY [Bacillota bacterium]
MSFFNRLKQGLQKTRHGFIGKIEQLITGRKLDEELFEELEELLITSDVGVRTALDLVEELRELARSQKLSTGEELRELLQQQLRQLLGDQKLMNIEPGRLNVIVVVGVNGVGKTTTIAKLAHRYKNEGLKVMLAAGDTFRAAAAEQLEIWGRRMAVPVLRHDEGADPAAVVYDALQSAKARQIEVLIVDTAGRLHTKSNLMHELEKIGRVVGRECPGAPHEVLLVIDATTGQNAVVQAEQFAESVPLTGLVLTKMDGTAKGGIIFAIANQQKLPVKFIGVGETMDDLRDFQPDEFVAALFDREN